MEYGWTYVQHGPLAFGPYLSRQAAIDAARASAIADGWDGTSPFSIRVGPIGRPSAMKFAMQTAEISTLLVEMDDLAREDGFHCDGEKLFQCTHRDALGALQNALGEWARKYVTSRSFQFSGDTEVVELDGGQNANT